MTSAADTESAIDASGLTKRFGKTSAVSDLTLSIPVGSTFGFIGPNGAGKGSLRSQHRRMPSPRQWARGSLVRHGRCNAGWLV